MHDNPLPSYIRRTAQNAASLNMRKFRRDQWNEADWAVLIETKEKLIRSHYSRLGEAIDSENPFQRFQMIDILERNGHLHGPISDIKSKIAIYLEKHG
ncbi:hypothetical protein [Methylocella sp. CPCC 101449]|jgi:hypothetical protein|uniref:hypothetical protein n=1 Tax=Methylocella sp. CPCC 101449 TaxID=2987531 RepID=UPI00288C957F|nr:hypothetical protein [Methylocella sp. CPCC 101449]MDT2022424.1 hypothetical protein [Methylocella sp. CPCC 101449]HEV2572849.1 hypothetical protein [Beijerinckiaceae bacterium]